MENKPSFTKKESTTGKTISQASNWDLEFSLKLHKTNA